MKYCLILSESSGFPWGMAATSRIKNIGKALLDEGADVSYIGLQGTGIPDSNQTACRGSFEGIAYSYPGGFTVRSKNWVVRRMDDFLGKWLSLLEIKRLVKQKSLDTVIIYSRSYKTLTYWSEKLRQLKIPVILELCEWPLANGGTDKATLENAENFCTKAILKVDAVLPISKYIEDKVKEVAAKNAVAIPSFRIPILTDTAPETAYSGPKTGVTEEYMIYSGSVYYVNIAFFIIDIVSNLQNKGYRLKLLFTGGGNIQLFDRVRAYSKEKNVADLVEFTGFVKETDLLNLMADALCLLAPLPETEQSEARFPTKIGYYLSSGRPLLTNVVGSVNEYLEDEVNAYIVKKYDAGLFADKIIDSIDSPVKASAIGVNGRQLAIEKFYYKNACRGLKGFLESISKRYT